jgi:Na+:H+ antiporter, NhaA family
MTPRDVVTRRHLSVAFREFFDSEKAGGLLLVGCTAVSILLANSAIGHAYIELWHFDVGGMSLETWVNDALMAVFFLTIGLELERELYVGELSDFRNALLPIVAAAGGVALPALIHFSLNAGRPTQPGIGIPMATDIAFALGVLSLVGRRVPASLKVFLAALAVADDLAAVLVIALFYSSDLSVLFLVAAVAVFGALVVLNRFRVLSLVPYVLGGALMWFLMLRSGVHATIAGILLAFAIPFTGSDDRSSPSHRVLHALHRPVAFVVLPIFALANTAIELGGDSGVESGRNTIGIALGLLVGKPVGITLAAFAAISLGLCRLPADLGRKHIFGAGLLGGIGFTMSIFVTNLAFPGDQALIDDSKKAILLASLGAGLLGFAWLKAFGQPMRGDDDPNTMDFAPDHDGAPKEHLPGADGGPDAGVDARGDG